MAIGRHTHAILSTVSSVARVWFVQIRIFTNAIGTDGVANSFPMGSIAIAFLPGQPSANRFIFLQID
jgi:hypothetical protein